MGNNLYEKLSFVYMAKIIKLVYTAKIERKRISVKTIMHHRKNRGTGVTQPRMWTALRKNIKKILGMKKIPGRRSW